MILEEWMRWVAYFVFLDDEEENIYTLEDGKPYTPNS
jgi:hypothetical protein